uniref:Uncharacterized protein n=1 Tax=Steinernema glaseri TaxID=37863 RepID=A0A1I7YUR5_9BILA
MDRLISHIQARNIKDNKDSGVVIPTPHPVQHLANLHRYARFHQQKELKEDTFEERAEFLLESGGSESDLGGNGKNRLTQNTIAKEGVSSGVQGEGVKMTRTSEDRPDIPIVLRGDQIPKVPKH